VYNGAGMEGEELKRRDLIKKLERAGWHLDHEGGNHTIYKKGDAAEAIPRHNEIEESLAKAIIKRRVLK
jgi:mRNA interferase HicA